MKELTKEQREAIISWLEGMPWWGELEYVPDGLTCEDCEDYRIEKFHLRW